jgi:hypothetical protein
VVARKLVWDAAIVEPLYETLGYEGTDGLGGIAGMAKVGQMDSKKSSLECYSVRMWAAEKVGVFFLNCSAMWAAVVFERVVPVDLMSHREPAVDVFEELLVLE